MIRIQVRGLDAEGELLSLHAWLQDEPAVRNNAHISLQRRVPQKGEMGSAFDIIQLSIDSSFQVLSLALAYAAWRDTRVKDSKVTIERGQEKITLTGVDEDTVKQIVQTLAKDPT